MFPWVYRGEGNQHIVISDEQRHIVYRMFKRMRSEQKTKIDYDIHRQRLQRCLDFISNVMLPLFHSDYLHCGSLVEIPESTACVIKKCLDNRPSYRQHKELDSACPYALQMPDYCYINDSVSHTLSPHTSLPASKPVYTVEIKPKWGFMPVSEHISMSRQVKYSVCRFCMHQHLKLFKGKWKIRSQYCPIDLFSGDVSRMKHALTMLFNVPQNNLRLFKNGELIWNDLLQEEYGSPDVLFLRKFSANGTEDITSVRSHFDDFLDLLIKALLHKFREEKHHVITYSHSPANHGDSRQTRMCRSTHNTPPTPNSSVIVSHDNNRVDGLLHSAQLSMTYSSNTCHKQEVDKADNLHSKPEEGHHFSISDGSMINGTRQSSAINRSESTAVNSYNFIIKQDSDFKKKLAKNGLRPEIAQPNCCIRTNHCNFDNCMYPETCKESTYKKKIPKTSTPKTALPEGCILYQVQKVQKLDSLDIEGIIPLYEMVKRSMNNRSDKNNSDTDPYHFSGPFNATWWTSNISHEDPAGDQLSCAVQKIKEYLVSRSAKDCSIMISLQQHPSGQDILQHSTNTSDSSTASGNILSDGHWDLSLNKHQMPVSKKDLILPQLRNKDPINIGDKQCTSDLSHNCSEPAQQSPTSFVIQDRHGVTYKAVVGVIDLDPKCFDKIPQYMLEDEEVVNCYLSYQSKKYENL